MRPETVLYFAYGPDISSRWMRHVLSSVRPTMRGWLGQHRIYFHKLGTDGSGKCDAFFTGNDKDNILGLLYEIAPGDKDMLAKTGEFANGYAEKAVSIITDEGKKVDAFTYCATNIETALKPFHWYKGHVLIGAREFDFPGEYTSRFLSVESIDDPDSSRESRELAIQGIGQSRQLGRL
ncbi:MAG: gamma-glutamylcyclotransferase [Proteobacteria bacterium]|nr:gamma-glutamylcyclotransferase [Pseudomonadota bacterium]